MFEGVSVSRIGVSVSCIGGLRTEAKVAVVGAARVATAGAARAAAERGGQQGGKFTGKLLVNGLF